MMEKNKIKKIKKRIFFEKKFIHFVNVEIHPRLRAVYEICKYRNCWLLISNRKSIQ